MSILSGLGVFLLTVLFMEGFAYVAHRWLMHGPGWFLHKSHHRPRTGTFELNDLYAVIFAVPSISLFWYGIGLGHGAFYAWIGGGIAAYGVPFMDSIAPVVWGVQNENLLTSIPLFVMLGELLLRSGIADT